MSDEIPVIQPVDREVQTMLDQANMQGQPRLVDMTPQEARDWCAELFIAIADPVEVASITDHEVPVDGGEIICRVYDPCPDEPLAVMVYIHGGGWVLGDLDGADPYVRRLADTCRCVIVSVGYRLAPECPFPVPFEDCLTAVRWTASHAAELGGVAGAPLAIGGDSAGGNLAAACALALRDEDTIELSCQFLIYPVIDADFERPSMITHATGKLLEREVMQWFWDHYCPEGAMRSDWRACPIKADSLAGLPPAIVTLASHDPLYDEGLEYARRLEQSGVPVTLLVAPDLIHGYTGLADQFVRCREEVTRINLAMSHLMGRVDSS